MAAKPASARLSRLIGMTLACALAIASANAQSGVTGPASNVPGNLKNAAASIPGLASQPVLSQGTPNTDLVSGTSFETLARLNAAATPSTLSQGQKLRYMFVEMVSPVPGRGRPLQMRSAAHCIQPAGLHPSGESNPDIYEVLVPPGQSQVQFASHLVHGCEGDFRLRVWMPSSDPSNCALPRCALRDFHVHNIGG